jgi:diacylglycerol kinase (ATP)
LKIKGGVQIILYFYDLFNKKQLDTGLQNVLTLSNKSQHVNAIICGGDGTVLWVVTLVLKMGVNFENIGFGVIPLGTGNDFSRSLGWGGSPIHF